MSLVCGQGGPLRRALTLVGLSVLLAACGLASPATTLTPQSDFGRRSHDIFLQVLWWDVGIFVVVALILAVALLRFRERDPAALPRQIRGDARLELAWTVAPVLVLTFIAFPTVRVIFQTQGAPRLDALNVRVIGHQWWWEFQYPALGFATATDLHLPAGQPVVLEITGPDVIHSFWVPQLGGKRDAIPGQVNRIVLTAATPGEYPGQCAEFCGVSHANMRHTAVVLPAAEFQAWAAAQQATPAEPAEGSPAARGREVFRTSACVGCHTIRGLSAGILGPDLTHVGSRRTLAGGMLANRPESLARWLKDPPAVKPGSLMPALRLSDPDVAALVAYLTSLK
jgi:cytochrome c oxidase subunit 2